MKRGGNAQLLDKRDCCNSGSASANAVSESGGQKSVELVLKDAASNRDADDLAERAEEAVERHLRVQAC